MFSIMKTVQLYKITIYAQEKISIRSTMTSQSYNIPPCMPIPNEPINNYVIQENVRLEEIRRQMLARQ
ncbi:hypothetical protein ACJIZ3_014436 [Penstemon smallii]|uniref:Uncharacterized protein n=1 Tax=Penstemon smallii TaxID=265156 RepID=A0ABD3RJN6_9LAMI